LLDRDAERAAIDELLEAVRRGFSGVLMLRGGAPGVGKTTLAGYAIEAASGFQISAISGVESEINLEYSAVHQLLVPFLPLTGDLPGPQRQHRRGFRPRGRAVAGQLSCRARLPHPAFTRGC
jgi:hypothetical protein